MAKPLHADCQLGNSNLLCMVLDVSHVRHQALFSCQFYHLNKGHHILVLQKDFELRWKSFVMTCTCQILCTHQEIDFIDLL